MRVVLQPLRTCHEVSNKLQASSSVISAQLDRTLEACQIPSSLPLCTALTHCDTKPTHTIDP